MSKQVQKKKSNAPFIIIGLLAVVVVGAVLYGVGAFGGGSKNTNTAANKPGNSNAAKTSAIPTNAPPGAMPPQYAGSPTATVTIEEFADFQCGSCAATFPIMNEIKSMYGSRIKFIYRNFPLAIPQHDKSYDAAVALEAAGMQGKYWEMLAQLFQNQQKWTSDPNFRQIWNDYAKQIGLDVNKFTTDLAGIAAKGRVDADMARGRALNVNSTPTLYINGVMVPYNDVKVDSLKVIIDAELAKAAAPAAANPATPATPSK
ncbi:MAG: thioredoxin domain-containing protein [Pyrinomonadaceae bacterium]|nr:thioredoxin domain-containing protein [Acidobacteriota bacterium]MBK7932657.1 thioredoxin domain-containing protein [Acidobacteriota bacterium]MBP7375846.1 thioredoxin domain-containing protein [Pyrinomonadaceae bacterium]